MPYHLHDIEDKVSVLAKIIPDDLEINQVALCAGSGKSFIQDVVEKNVDLYITGELGYHDMQYLRQQKVGVYCWGIISLNHLF